MTKGIKQVLDKGSKNSWNSICPWDKSGDFLWLKPIPPPEGPAQSSLSWQSQDKIKSVRLLRKEVLQNISDAESCYLIRALLNFYLNTVFKNYHKKAAEFRIQKSFSTLANNFIVILSKLQPSQEKFSTSESARRRFLLFQGAFKQLDIEAAQTKAFGEVDILLTWMQKFYQL
ncbi:LOW QUALITY PROTEIN: interleukin-24 [Phyllostomus discolor]|uniref:LOW QUALITY PROTEIN: interleukin-24 n=1 Tax=Phyllostomus discolor TaxID=89673 RepID=A0A7E6CVU2_9CHIR|nr:LOW QUALITY PROTEIN: interleukin-24 [Phyllostomus discolor]